MPPPRIESGTHADDQAELLTVTQAVQRAGVTPSTVSGWITGGKLPVVRVGVPRGGLAVHLTWTDRRLTSAAVPSSPSPRRPAPGPRRL